jgi:hypothetical protein
MSVRVVSLYSTRPPARAPEESFNSTRVAGLGEPVAKRWQLGGLKDHFDRAGDQSPRILDERDAAGRRLTLVTQERSAGGPRLSPRYRITGWRSTLIIVPYSGVVAMLDIAAEGDFEAIVQLLGDAYYRRDKLKIDGEDAAKALAAAIPDAAARHVLTDAREDLYAHQVVVLPDLKLLRAARFGRRLRSRRGTLAAEIDTARVRDLLYRGETSRPEQQGGWCLPSEANRPPGLVVAMQESVTLLAGFPGHEQYAINTMLLSAAQLMSSAARARHIRHSAYQTLRDLRRLEDSPGTNVGQQRRELAALSARLGTLETEVSFGVQAHTDIGIMLPFGRVASYHRDLVTLIGLPRAIEVASHQIERLARSIAAAHEAASGRERAKSDRFQLGLAVVAALIVAPSLATGFYGANIRGFPGYDDASGVGYLVALMGAFAVLAVVVAVLLWRWADRRV